MTAPAEVEDVPREEEEIATPALFDHCVRLYDYMFREAKYHEPPEDAPEGAQGHLIWEGFLTKVITQELDLSVPYYTHCRRALINMGCLGQLRRGGSTGPSQWELLRPPNIEDFLSAQGVSKSYAQKRKKGEDTQNQRISDLSTRLATLEEQFSRLLEVLAVKQEEEAKTDGD